MCLPCLAKSLDVDATVESLIELLHKFKEAMPHSSIFLSGILPRADHKFNQAMLEVNRRTRGFCEKRSGLYFIDHGSHFQHASGDLKEYLFEDNKHLNNRKGTVMLVRHYKQSLHEARQARKSHKSSGNTFGNANNTKFTSNNTRDGRPSYHRFQHLSKQGLSNSHRNDSQRKNWQNQKEDKLYNKTDVHKMLSELLANW